MQGTLGNDATLLLQLNAARQRFTSPESDHVTFINVFKSYQQELEKNQESQQVEQVRSKADKNVKKWCTAHYINSRSLRRALEIHRFRMWTVFVSRLLTEGCECSSSLFSLVFFKCRRAVLPCSLSSFSC